MALYSRLFRFFERQRLEDFLTEALADLLEKLARVDREGMLSFVEDALLGGETTSPHLRTALLERIRDASQLEWRTQVSIPSGRPDMVLCDERGPFLVIENKVGAGFTTKEEEAADEEGEEGEQEEKIWLSQLSRYDRWLSAEERKGSPVALVLLTHWTDPPKGFVCPDGNEHDKYETSMRAVARWRGVHKRLDSYSKAMRRDPNLGAALASDLAAFLEEQGMSAQITVSDLSAARLFLAGKSGDRLLKMMEELRKEAQNFIGDGYKMAPKFGLAGDFVAEGKVWDWFYQVQEGNYVGWVAWGIRFPVDFQPKVDQFFVAIESSDTNNKSLRVPDETRAKYQAKGWDFPGVEHACEKTKSMYHFLEVEDPWETLLAWFRESAEEAVDILEKDNQ